MPASREWTGSLDTDRALDRQDRWSSAGRLERGRLERESARSRMERDNPASDLAPERTASERTASERAETPRANDDPRYRRPSSYRTGVREQVWNDAVQPETGRVRDPESGQFMSAEKRWDMGHKPGYEFRKHQRSAAERNIDRSEFLDEHNNPEHYRPELPLNNQSHRGEAIDEDFYLGD